MYTPPSSIAGNIRTTTPVNEPVHDYAPGSPEAVRPIEEIQRVGSAVRELPHVIDGERLALERPSMSWHAHVLGRYSTATAQNVGAAIAAALAARPNWSRTPWWERAAGLLCTAELVSGKYPERAPRHHDARPVQTFHQAEIDAAC